MRCGRTDNVLCTACVLSLHKNLMLCTSDMACAPCLHQTCLPPCRDSSEISGAWGLPHASLLFFSSILDHCTAYSRELSPAQATGMPKTSLVPLFSAQEAPTLRRDVCGEASCCCYAVTLVDDHPPEPDAVSTRCSGQPLFGVCCFRCLSTPPLRPPQYAN